MGKYKFSSVFAFPPEVGKRDRDIDKVWRAYLAGARCCRECARVSGVPKKVISAYTSVLVNMGLLRIVCGSLRSTNRGAIQHVVEPKTGRWTGLGWIIQHYLDGMSIEEIAVRRKCSVRRIRDLLDSAGISGEYEEWHWIKTGKRKLREICKQLSQKQSASPLPDAESKARETSPV